MTPQEYSENIEEMLKWDPQIIIDDGGDVVSMIIDKEKGPHPKTLLGGCEETTTGIKAS
jgi:adenosylhomocysteinase